jgi:chitodextrinase
VSLNGVAGATVTTTSYVFSGLTCGTTYQLGVAARDAAGNFSPTSTVSGATAACPSGDTTPPTVPAGFAVTALGSFAVATTWTASTDPDSGVAGYQLSVDGQPVATTTSTAYTFSGLTPATQYTLAVDAFDASGNHSDPALLTVTTAAPTAFVNPCGVQGTSAPATYRHVIWIWMENQSSSVLRNAASAPYLSQLASECGTSSQWLDDLFAFNSEPEYEAAVSGSNCDVGFASVGTNCNLGNDAAPANSVVLAGPTIFDQVTQAGGSWKAYEEGMGTPCNFKNDTVSGYGPKHNPPVFFATLTGGSHTAPAAGSPCLQNDLPIPLLNCPTLTYAPCTGTAAGAFADDLANDTLPTFSIVTPNACNDMHDCNPAAADNWLQAWLPLIAASPAYQSGSTAVFLLWDEGTFGLPQAGVVIAPWIDHLSSSASLDNLAVLGATESMLGLPDRLGCASGTPPGGVSACPVTATADVRSIFGL